MTITTALCESYKRELLMGLHAITDDYRMALYVDGARLSAATTAYSDGMRLWAKAMRLAASQYPICGLRAMGRNTTLTSTPWSMLG